MGNTHGPQESKPKNIAKPIFTSCRKSLQMQCEYEDIKRKSIQREFLGSQLNFYAFKENNPDLEHPKWRIEDRWERYVDKFQVHKRVMSELTRYSSRSNYPETRADVWKDRYLQQIHQLRKQNPPVKKLNLSFAMIGINDREMTAFSNYIGRYLSSLKHLKFYLVGYHVTDKSLNSLGSWICSHLINLKSFAFVFDDSQYVSYPGFSSFLNQVCRQLIWLESLSLTFIKCDVLNNPLDKSSEALKARYSSLKKVSLSFKYLREITIGGIQTLSFIQHHKSLRELQLSFSECRGMTDEKFELLLSIISRNMNKLELLNLRIYNSLDITDRSMKAIETIILPGLIHLKALKLEFTRCPITEQAIADLANAISRQNLSLERLLLYFRHITANQFWQEIRSKLSSIPMVLY